MPTNPRSPAIKVWIWVIGFFTTLFFTVVLVYIFRQPDSFVGQVELKTVDLRFRLRGMQESDPQILLCAIDQKAIDTYGRWPWPRGLIAKLIENLHAGNARVIALDIAFITPQANTVAHAVAEMDFLPASVRTSETMTAWLDRYEDDHLLAEAIRAAGNVVLGYFFLMSPSEVGHFSAERIEQVDHLLAPYNFAVVRQFGDQIADTVQTALGAEPNIPILSTSAAGAGFFNVMADGDGTQRHKSLVMRYGEDYYPSLELEALRVYFKHERPDLTLELSEFGVSNLRVGELDIPADEQGRILINFKGPARTYPTLSAADVLSGRIGPKVFDNKLVLLGATAPGVFDETVTPFSRQGYPGLEVRATALDNILNRNSLFMPTSLRLLDLLIILLLPLLLTFLLSRIRPIFGMVSFLVLTTGFLLFCQIAFVRFHLVFAVMPTLMALSFVFTGALVVDLLHEIRTKGRLRNAFGQYLPPHLVDKISEDPSLATLGGTEIQGTVLFCDIVGFTRIASRLSAEDTVSLLNSFHGAMNEVVFECGGTLDKFIGDAMMALWGAPLPDEQHAHKACQCALKMIARLDQLNDRFGQRGLPPLGMRIGVNSGLMIAGNMGGTKRFDYTVIGDTVNRASRLERLCAQTSARVLIGEGTMVLARDRYAITLVGRYSLVEGTPPVPVFTLDSPAL